MHGKKVSILRSIPGGGKSKWALDRFEADQDSVIVCSADDYFTNPVTGEYLFDAKKLGLAHAQCQETFLQALRSGVPTVIVDNCNSRLWEYRVYVEMAEMMGYDVEILEFTVPENRVRETIKKINARQVHAVPVTVILRIWWYWETDSRAKLIPVTFR